MSELLEVLLSDEASTRDQALDDFCSNAGLAELIAHAERLDEFRRDCDNLYHRVRALFFLAAIYRYHVPRELPKDRIGHIPFEGYHHLIERRFAEGIDTFLAEQQTKGVSDAIASALASSYYQLAFQTLADQVRRSVRTVRGNQWMFRMGHVEDHPLRVRQELLQRSPDSPAYPTLHESTAVRMDFSHSAWSDIFFLGMDFPEGARVLNVSIDLGVVGRDPQPQPPIETYFRVIDEPLIRLVCVDLNAVSEVRTLSEMFDFARDYTGLLKAAVIGSGLIPPGIEGSSESLQQLLELLVGEGRGFELVSRVNNIPKGSRLAVSTNLLGSLISVCMRASGQIANLHGGLEEQERRMVAARAILGEWIGGSGGGWQDSGGVWPGIKLIEGALAEQEDPEFGVSRGRLLPKHTVLDTNVISPKTRQMLQESLVLVHGGMAQNVGPILEMVTEKYLLRSKAEWQARREAIEILDQVVAALRKGDLREVGQITTRNFRGPLQTIIPWATNRFTEALIEKTEAHFGDRFWGFWMLGGMAGGGMGFIFDPEIKVEAQQWLQQTMLETKAELESALPFAMDPVVYNFQINDNGSWSELQADSIGKLPDDYYALMVPRWLKRDSRDLSRATRQELVTLGDRCQASQNGDVRVRKLVASLLPNSQQKNDAESNLKQLLEENGYDRIEHEQIRADLKAGRIGLQQNLLSRNVPIEDVEPEDVVDLRSTNNRSFCDLGEQAIRDGQVAVVTLAAGIGSRWTEGAGVVKALHPFCKIQDKHRSFLEVHLAKSRHTSETYDSPVPHVITTGYMTDQPIREHLAANDRYGYQGEVIVSRGNAVGLRFVPMVRDLRFAWEQTTQQVLDEQRQKVRDSQRAALINWAQSAGEGSDYTDNVPMQCLHPVGHWYEIPNLMRNGTLARLLEQQPQLRFLLLHNIDTLGASLDPTLLGAHIQSERCLSYEVISRRLDDRGGGLARVGGQPRLVEGLSIPDEKIEFRLSFYNSMTTWIDIDQLLEVFGLDRLSLQTSQLVEQALRNFAQRMPTYITLKDVKKRWGHGQEDVFPVAQFEKLWGDMSALPEVGCQFLVTPLQRGQQLKEQSQLDGWLRDGSAEYLRKLTHWR